MDERALNGILQSLDRRTFIRLSGKGIGFAAVANHLSACGGSSAGENNTNTPVDQEQTPTTDALPVPSQAYLMLSRTSFGVTHDDLALVEQMGIDAYLDQQLDPGSMDTSALENEIAVRFPLTQSSAAELYNGFPDNIGEVAQQMVAATQYRQLFSKRQLYELMVEFWSNHFNIHLLNGLGPTLKPVDDKNVIRPHALGNFRDLLHTSAKSPAMLFYLDNFYNQAEAPNENYARELLELHTLGVDGGYSELDIKQVARCFTGWSLTFPGQDEPFGEYRYYDFLHDKDAKQVLGLSIAAGGAEEDGEQVLDYLATHPSTAQFISTKLCRYFISDTPSDTLINAVASRFMETDGDIKSVLRTLFTSAEFLESYDLKFSTPSQYLGRLIRSLNTSNAFPSDQGLLFYYAQYLLGQLPFNWATPDGYPQSTSYWSNTGSLLNRWRFSFLSFANQISAFQVFTINWAHLIGGANTTSELVTALESRLLCRTMAEEDRQTIMDWLLTTLNTTEDGQLNDDIINAIVPAIAAVMASSVYFQMR